MYFVLLFSEQAAGLADSDPHFIVKVKGLKYAICFDVMGEQGDVYQLIKDKYSGKKQAS